MSTTLAVRGDIPAIVRNDGGLYEGDLKDYFRAVFRHAKNHHNPYHNFRHMFHILWLCYQACHFYAGTLSPRAMRDLLIAAMFHDFDHSGKSGNDDLNIELALRGLKRHILPMDAEYFGDIAAIIHASEFPYKAETSVLGFTAQILRDADISQALSPAWIQHVVFGLAAEWGKDPLEVLKMQEPFHRGIKPVTEWGRQMFPQAAIDAKIAEAKELLEIIGSD